MADAKILDMPMEFGLELMAIIRPDFADAERELFNDVVNKVDCIGLGVLFVNLQRPNPRCVIDGGVLEPAYLLTFLVNEGQELNIHLDVMAGYLLLITFGVNLAHASAAREAVQPMAAQDARNRGVRQFDVVIALQVPDDPHRAEVILAPKIKYLVLALRRRPIGMPLGNGRRVDQASFATLRIGLTPTVEAGSTYPEIAASPRDVTDLLRMSQYPQLALDLALIFGHEHLLLPKPGRLKKMSRE